jgi:hypothetical protein
MIKFPASGEIEVFVNNKNQIVIKETDYLYGEEVYIALSITQFSEIVAHANDLIALAKEVGDDDAED